MPKEDIWKWRESRVIKYFFICLFLWMVLGMIASAIGIAVGNWLMLPNFNTLSQPMSTENGGFIYSDI